MLLSVQTAPILDTYGIDEGFRRIAAAGFDGVDFNIDHTLPGGKIRANDCSGFFDQTDEEMIEATRPYKEAAEKYGVKFIQAHAPFPTLVKEQATNEYVLKALKKTIMLMGYVGCKNLVVHPGFMPADEKLDPDAEWEYNVKMYTALIPELKKYGVTCCLENMFTRHRGKVMEAICSDPYEACAYVDHLNEVAGEMLFGFCLDTGHANLLGHDLYDVIRKLGDRITVLHVHDNGGVNDDHMFPFMGITDWNRFCEGLKAIGYDRPLSFETFHAMEVADPAVWPEMLALLHAIGRRFAEKIEGA